MHIVLIYTGEFFSQSSPTGGIFQMHQAKVLSARHKVAILNPCLVSPRHIFKNFDKKKYIKYQNIDIYKNYKKNIFPGKIKLFNFLLKRNYEKLILELFREYIKKNGYPDICHVFDIRFGLIAGTIIKKEFKVPFIFSEYCVEVANNTLPLSNYFEKKIVKPNLLFADNLALPSKRFANKFKKYFSLKKKIKILPNVLPWDVENYKKNKNKNKKKNCFEFIVINRLDTNKNTELIIKSYISLNKKDTKLIIIGNGPELKNIKKYFSHPKIVFFKKLKRKELIRKLSYADCLISASTNETFGVVLIEAASLGLSLISSNSEGPSEIINKKNGIIVKGYDIQKFVLAMNKIIENKHKYKKAKIKKDIIKRFGKKTYLKNFEYICKKIFKKNEY